MLNSYGRRANDNLLLEYGFAMLDNAWDTLEVVCSLSQHEPLYDRKKACLRANRQHALRYGVCHPPPARARSLPPPLPPSRHTNCLHSRHLSQYVGI